MHRANKASKSTITYRLTSFGCGKHPLRGDWQVRYRLPALRIGQHPLTPQAGAKANRAARSRVCPLCARTS